METYLKTLFSVRAVVKSRTAQKLLVESETRRAGNEQVNIQEAGLLRAKNIPDIQRILQESFLIPRGAHNYLHLPEQL